MAHRRALIAVAAAVAAGLALAGCSDGGDVATMSGTGGASQGTSPEEEQAAGADKLSACLDEAGIPHDSSEWEDGQKQINFWSGDEPMAVSMGLEAGVWWSPGNTSTEAEAAAALARIGPLVAVYDPAFTQTWADMASGGVIASDATGAEGGADPRYLILGQVDHTEAFVKCLDDSGYTQPVWHADPADELKDKQRIAAATAEWAECARQNGFPSVKDPDPPVADNYKTSPLALLPGDISEQALRDLLAICPNFDADKMRAREQAMAEMDPNAIEEDWARLDQEYDTTEPSIGFDVPGYDGGPAAADEDAATAERLSKLYDVLWEAANEYWAHYQEQQMEEVPAASAG